MAEIRLAYSALGVCGTNCYIIYEEHTKEAVIVDPADAPERIRLQAEKLGVSVKGIWLTHGHFDHMLAADALRKEYGVKIWAMKAEKELLESPAMNLSAAWAEPAALTADEWLEDGQRQEALGTAAEVLHTPGHTPGSCCFYFKQENILISGDTLFRESLGRTDFPGSSTRDIILSIRRLFELPDETAVYPGHGDETSIGYEKIHNPVALYRG